jgi:hypothetical protein
MVISRTWAGLSSSNDFLSIAASIFGIASHREHKDKLFLPKGQLNPCNDHNPLP